MKKLPIVQISFDDHAMSDGACADILRCEVFGVLYRETKTTYYVACWLAERTIGENSTTFAIRKHKGVKVKRLGSF